MALIANQHGRIARHIAGPHQTAGIDIGDKRRVGDEIGLGGDAATLALRVDRRDPQLLAAFRRDHHFARLDLDRDDRPLIRRFARGAGRDPASEPAVSGAVVFQLQSTAMGNLRGALGQQQAAFGAGEHDPTSAARADNRFVVGRRIEAEQAELEPGLPFRFAVATARIATRFREHRDHFVVERNRHRLGELGHGQWDFPRRAAPGDDQFRDAIGERRDAPLRVHSRHPGRTDRKLGFAGHIASSGAIDERHQELLGRLGPVDQHTGGTDFPSLAWGDVLAMGGWREQSDADPSDERDRSGGECRMERRLNDHGMHSRNGSAGTKRRPTKLRLDLKF